MYFRLLIMFPLFYFFYLRNSFHWGRRFWEKSLNVRFLLLPLLVNIFFTGESLILRTVMNGFTFKKNKSLILQLFPTATPVFYFFCIRKTHKIDKRSKCMRYQHISKMQWAILLISFDKNSRIHLTHLVCW